jgi:Uma2 family endonuclease
MPGPPTKAGASRYTWSDYQNWPDEERWEIIAGAPFAMSPAPSTQHQQVAGRLFSRLERALGGTPCRTFIAPTDLKLSDADVVQPDILVICDPTRIKPTHVEGPPLLVVEVLSPATATRDLREKKSLYESSGVKEYLVVDPMEHYAVRFLLGADGSFDKGSVIAADEMLVFESLEKLEVPLWEVFELPGPQTPAASE